MPIETLPTKAQLKEILDWLRQESEDSEEGFYCNKQIIIDSFNESQMHCFVLNRKTIGFGVFNIKTIGSSIDILEIHPHFRRNGYGSQLAQHFLKYLFEAENLFVTVQCAPKSTEHFWRKFGFQKYCDQNHVDHAPLTLKLIFDKDFIIPINI